MGAPHGVDLQLSGHTHGGQIFPGCSSHDSSSRYCGLKSIDGVRVYTHRRTGYWGPPVRLGARPEIAFLTYPA